jgi:peptide/nickel transport system ATP-binding protein
MSQPVLEVRDLTVGYLSDGEMVTACDSVSFDVAPQSVLGIVGESGSGKSTLITAITRLQRPPAVTVRGSALLRTPGGEIDLLVASESDLRPHRWASYAVVFQSAMDSLNPVMRVESQFVDLLRVHDRKLSKKAAQARTADLFEMVGIERSRVRAYPHQLSGGMRQRAAIALSLALEPQLIVMDEPTTAVDVVVQRQILGNVLELQERFGFSVVFVTHDLSLLLEFADQIAVMYAGRIVEHGDATQIYRDPLHPYTRGLRDSFPPLHGEQHTLLGIPGSPPDLRLPLLGCPFADRCPDRFEPCADANPGLVEVESRHVACWLHSTNRQMVRHG